MAADTDKFDAGVRFKMPRVGADDSGLIKVA
jgi:hypothetical protein